MLALQVLLIQLLVPAVTVEILSLRNVHSFAHIEWLFVMNGSFDGSSKYFSTPCPCVNTILAACYNIHLFHGSNNASITLKLQYFSLASVREVSTLVYSTGSSRIKLIFQRSKSRKQAGESFSCKNRLRRLSGYSSQLRSNKGFFFRQAQKIGNLQRDH